MLRSTLKYSDLPTPTSAASPSTTPIKDIVGQRLAKRLRKGLSPTHRALLAHDLETGECWLHGLTRRQACSVTGASLGYAATLAKATDEEVEALKRGKLSLAAMHNRQRVPTDADLDRYIARAGADRVMAALDRFTSPRFAFAAE